MRWLAVASLVVLLTGCTHANIVETFINQVTSIFRTYEPAPYTVTRIAPGYEERVYPARRWACKGDNNARTGEDLSPLFWSLFQYITGHNSRGQAIPMTVPVSTEFQIFSPTDKKYEMCFFIGDNFQQDPPAPNATLGVVIKNRPQLRVYTRTVDGYMTEESDWMEEAGRLAAVIQEDGKSVSLAHMYWVGYDAPLKFWNRRNEIWFPINN